jgi:hypothetical protein
MGLAMTRTYLFKRHENDRHPFRYNDIADIVKQWCLTIQV